MYIDKRIDPQQLEEAPLPQTFHIQLLDAIGQAVIAMDLDGIITCWNHAAETLYGWTADEVLGRNIVDVTPALSAHEEAEKIMETLRAGQRWTGAFPVQRSDGSVFLAQVTNSPLYDETGEMIGIVRVSEKIEAQEQRVHQLAFEKNRLHTLFEHAPAFMCLLRGPDYVLELANAAHHELTGQQDVQGKTVREALPELVEQGFLERLDKVYGTGEPDIGKEVPVYFRRTPGIEPETRFVNFVFQPLKDEGGTITGVLVHGVDVTEQVKARERARAASQYNQAIMDRSLDVICIFDEEGRFVQVSAASERIWGYRPHELLGRTYEAFVYPGDMAETLFADQRLRQGLDLTHFENRFVDKNGDLVDMMWSSTWSEEDRLFFAVGRDVTTIKERDRALATSNAAFKKSEHRLQALVNATAQVVWTADENGKATELSDTWTTLTGQTLEDLNNEGWAEVLHPDDWDRARDQWNRHLASKTAYELEYRIRCTDGAYRWVHAREVPVFDEDGNFVEWVGACIDIDDQKQAEAALRASEARYRSIIDTANEGVLLINPAGRATFVNARMAEMVGFRVEELQGRAFLDFVAEEDQAFIAQKFKQRWQGKTDTYDVRFRQRDGSIRWVLASVSPFYNEAGDFAGSLAMVSDITERKQAEEQVKRAKTRYERLVQHIDGIVWEATTNCSTGEIAFNFVSERLRDLLGFEPQDWVADAWLWVDAIHEEDRPWVPTACLNAVRAEEDHTLEYRMTAADGRVVWIRDIVRIAARQGDNIVMAGLMLDVTEQREAEEALIKAKQEAEEMARLKSAFLTNMSHEIRTPLAGILGFAEIIADEAVGEVREYAEIIGQSGERLKDTLNSVLDLARLESGSMRLAPENFDTVQQIEKLLPMFERQIREGLYLHLEPEVPHLWACLDKGAFSRILTNLISNGLKFTQQGGVTIRLGAGAQHIWIEVADTGIGISESFLSRLFEEFQQESAGLTRSYEGTGLGLPITKRLVELMGGTIQVESQKDVGTVFTVRLPIHCTG